MKERTIKAVNKRKMNYFRFVLPRRSGEEKLFDSHAFKIITWDKKCTLITIAISLRLKKRGNKEQKKGTYMKEIQKTETLLRTMALVGLACKKEKALILITVSLSLLGWLNYLF